MSVEREITWYEADDGEQFLSESACAEYERGLMVIRRDLVPGNTVRWSGVTRPESVWTSCAYIDTATRDRVLAIGAGYYQIENPANVRPLGLIKIYPFSIYGNVSISVPCAELSLDEHCEALNRVSTAAFCATTLYVAENIDALVAKDDELLVHTGVLEDITIDAIKRRRARRVARGVAVR